MFPACIADVRHKKTSLSPRGLCGGGTLKKVKSTMRIANRIAVLTLTAALAMPALALAQNAAQPATPAAPATSAAPATPATPATPAAKDMKKKAAPHKAERKHERAKAHKMERKHQKAAPAGGGATK